MKDVLVVDFISTSPIYTAYFSDGLNRTEQDVDILSPNNRLDSKFFDYLSLTYKGFNYKKGKLYEFGTYLFNWLYLLKHAHLYNAVHIQWFPFLQFSSLDVHLLKLLLFRNRNIFYTVHNILPHNVENKKIISRYRRIYALLPKLVVHTNNTKQSLIENFNVHESKIIRINHGPFFKGYSKPLNTNSSNEIKLGMIGFIRPYKGFEDAIKLVKMAKDSNIVTNLMIKGYGDEQFCNTLRNLVREYGVEDLVSIENKYLTNQEIITAHSQIDAILAPYRKIDQSGAVITSLSLGRPVLGYKRGGIKELIDNKKNGFLVDPDDLDKLITGIKWLRDASKLDLEGNMERSLEKNSWEESALKLKSHYLMSYN